MDTRKIFRIVNRFTTGRRMEQYSSSNLKKRPGLHPSEFPIQDPFASDNFQTSPRNGSISDNAFGKAPWECSTHFRVAVSRTTCMENQKDKASKSRYPPREV